MFSLPTTVCSRVCLCMCLCIVHVHMHVCVHVCACACVWCAPNTPVETEGQCQAPFCLTIKYVSLNLWFTDWLGWLFSKHLGCSCLHLLALGYKRAAPPLTFYVLVGDLNSSTSATKQSLQLLKPTFILYVMFIPLQHATWAPKGAWLSRACGLNNPSNKPDRKQSKAQAESLWVQGSHLWWGPNCDSKPVPKIGPLSLTTVSIVVQMFFFKRAASSQ